MEVLQTKYNGVLYRSRTEARWAVFFDVAGIRVEYEPEGYRLESVDYLPDFYAPDLNVFFEVKGTRPTDQEVIKAVELVRAAGIELYFLVGQTADGDYLLSAFDQANFGRLAPCRDCASIGKREIWAAFVSHWSPIKSIDNPRCDGKLGSFGAAVEAARNERFGVHDGA
jgi:hypothetical protein